MINHTVILQVDGFAITIAVVGYFVVFIALVLLYFIFYNLPFLLRINLSSLINRGKNKKEPKQDDSKMTGELNAAIGMALYLYFDETHDHESGVLTIKKVSRRYSPWSSKIYGIRQHPRQ